MTDYKENLQLKISKKTAQVGIVGLGYVGLPLLIRFCEVGYNVSGLDINDQVVSDFNNSKSYIKHIQDDEIASYVNKKQALASSSPEIISKCDVIIICVPTPLNKYREPDISYILSTLNSIKPYLKKGQLLSLESTTYPGTTEEEIVSRIELAGFNIGNDFFVAYSPEREDPGNANYSTSTIPKICGGHTKICLELANSLYSSVIQHVHSVSSTKAAEMTKLLENIHRAVNIGLANEMKVVADRMDLDIFEIINAAATKPFGFTPYYPGPGLGGHCIPIDPFYLTWKAREYGLHTRFIELAGEINQLMPEFVFSKAHDALNNLGKSIKGSKVLILGIAYKKNIGDTRESPSIEIMQMLHDKGAHVEYNDPFVSHFPIMKKYKFKKESIELSKKNLKSFDLIILTTDHDEYNFEEILTHSRLIIDTRGSFPVDSNKVIRA